MNSQNTFITYSLITFINDSRQNSSINENICIIIISTHLSFYNISLYLIKKHNLIYHINLLCYIDWTNIIFNTIILLIIMNKYNVERHIKIFAFTSNYMYL